MNGRLDAFVKKYKLAVDTRAFESECLRFTGEMEKGLAAGGGSLHMIPSFISDEGRLPANKKIITVDAGGTNLRVATVHFDGEGKPVIEHFSKRAMPGTDREITADDFFGHIAKCIRPFAEESDLVGVCFSYAAEITQNRDASVIELGKELKVSDINGRLVCEEIQKHLDGMGVSKKKFTVVNDTVATLLAAKTAQLSASNDGYFGFILGTGTNVCYTEKKANITRLPPDYPVNGGMIINVESGYYDLFDRGEIDEQLDAESELPGSHVLEKMISGAYLGSLSKRVLQKAAAEGLFSDGAAKMIMEIEDIPLIHVDRLYEGCRDDNPLAECLGYTEDDLAVGTGLIDCVMKRAAYLVNVVIGAVLLKTGAGKSNTRPALICVDGTTFYKCLWLYDHVFELSGELVTGKLNRFFTTVRIEDAPLIGTAVAGLTN